MRYFFCLVILFLIENAARAQSSGQEVYYAQQLDQAQKLTNEGKFEESDKIVWIVLQVFPENPNASLLFPFNQINLNNLGKARQGTKVGLLIDPSYYQMHFYQAYVEAALGDDAKAHEALKLAIQHGPEKMDMAALKKEFELVGRNTGKSEAFQNLYSWYEQNISSLAHLNTLDKTRQALASIASNTESLKLKALQEAQGYAQVNRHDLAIGAYYFGSLALQKAGFPSEALEVAAAGYVSFQKNGFGGNYFQASRLLAHLMDLNLKKLDYDNALSYQADAEKLRAEDKDYSHLPTYHVQSEVFVALATANSSKGKAEDNIKKARELAFETFRRCRVDKYQYGVALAVNALVITHDDEKNAATGIQSGEIGLRIARELNLDIKETIASNMAFCYYGLGTTESKQKAYDLYRNQAEKALAAGNWEAAATDINNLGTLLMYAENWDRAAQLFEEVVKLDGYGPKYANYRDRLTFYKRQVAAYQSLIRCYAHLGNAEKAFQAMEASRSRVLLERIGNRNYKQVSLIDLQNLLKPDEACIMYSVTAGHEIIILTVSKKYSQVLFHEDPRFIGEIKEKIWKNAPVAEPARREDANLNKFVISTLGTQTNVARDNFDKVAMAPKSDMDKAYRNLNTFMAGNNFASFVPTMQDFLYRFQKYLIVPVSNRLTNIKNLIIAPDDVFNFIPFEALRAFDGKYMVEKYNFRYIHSASVLMALEQRKYADSRKPLLAMGGATFDMPDAKALPNRTDADMNLLETEVYENIKTGKSQRSAYATLNKTKWDFLKGSADEVKNIARVVPGTETFLGNDMTENRIKEMSRNGQLKNYKILHLATHGFVEESIPDLSGIVMTLTKTEQDGEDGYLNTSEIASLQLNTDLTVLSACETARGQLFAGEGVTGITQSLIVAGSNAALVSLWKVDDVATMNFMSSFYKEVAKGKPYAQIVNELKKKFIKGDFGKEFTHPHYWAPFVYYGN